MGRSRRSIFAVELLALAAIASGLLVLAGWFPRPGRWGLVGALLIVAILHMRRDPPAAPAPREEPAHAMGNAIAIATAAIAAVLPLAMSATTASIRSPWSVVPSAFTPLVALTVAILVLVATRGDRATSSLARIGLGSVLAIGSLVALFVYPLGFGFDHFLHAAAERIIATTGALSPPPFFYGAHYGLVVLASDLLGFPVALVDRLLVPTLAVVLLPPLAHRALRAVLPERAAILGIFALAIVPFLPLAVSTPQALANLFALCTVLLLAGGATLRSAAPPAAAALLSQPITGLPIVATVAIAALLCRGRRAFAAIAGVLGALAMPLAFAVAPRILPSIDIRVAPAFGRAWQRLTTGIAHTLAYSPRDFSHADALAIAWMILPIAWITFALIGVRRVRRDRHPHAGALIVAPLIALVAAALVDATVTIPMQLPEEHAQFPLRLVELASLLATPLAAVGLGTILDRTRGRARLAAAALVLGVAATFTLVLAYPRDDAQAQSGLWSVSGEDLAAVQAIAEDAGAHRYVVLANQMLGAAAVREFGFRPSFVLVDGREVMAFPLPAGGPIAQRFWAYVSMATPSREPINAAMDLVGADRAYVVLHDYWRNYERLAIATATIADAEAGQFLHLRIFRFERSGQTPTKHERVE